MRKDRDNKAKKLSFFLGLFVFALASTLQPSAANAQSDGATGITAPAPQASTRAAKRYFVEFRARSALSYGHTFLVHGKLNAAGQLGQLKKEQVAGLHPATDSSIPWMLGHLIPVISETGWSDGDIEDEYITARYRLLLTEAEYAKVSQFIVKHQKNSPMWHAVLYNCNAWVGDVAKFMGLKTPDSTLLYPEDYINTLAKLNGGQSRPVPQATSKPAKPAQQASAPAPSAQ